MYYYNGAQKSEGFVGFEKACSRADLRHPNVTKLPSVHITVDEVNFCDGLICVYVKYKSHVSTERQLPDLYMGFLMVKTWPLIACEMAFYAKVECPQVQTAWRPFSLLSFIRQIPYSNLNESLIKAIHI